MDIFIPQNDNIKVQYINLENTSFEDKIIEIKYILEPVLGVSKETNTNYILCRENNNCMELKNPYSIEFSHFTPFIYVLNESENIEYNFDLESYTTSVKINLKKSSKQAFAIILGASEENGYLEAIRTKYSSISSIENEYENTKKYWNKLVKRDIKTGDKYTDIMANGWLIYQTIVCRLFARSGFYQSGGAIGFRDQLQDTLALISKWPEKTRSQIILNSSKQFEKGDVLHWWHDHNGAGIRTYFSDDYLWLAYVLSEYIQKTKDISILDVKTNYLEDKAMNDKRELYDVFKSIDKEATVYEHAKQTILYGLSRVNSGNGLLDIGDGDWNDGFSNIRGQSVWLTFFMINILEKFSEVSKIVNDEEMIKLCEKQRHILKHNIVANAWDGSHFIRAFFENGEILGSMSNRECKIDLISQAWAVIAMKNYLDLKDELQKSLESVETYLVDKKNMIVKLLYPPFDKPKNNPGYIKAYVPGTRENGGQYTHAATWLAKAYFELNEYEKGMEILKMINPISHSDTKEKADIYMVEPYVVAADIYSTPEHVGRGGWTWYTGSSAWMYKIIEDYLEKK